MEARVSLEPFRTREAVVEQAIDIGVTSAFRKEMRPVPLERGGLVLVRKRAASAVAPRGAVLLLHGYAQNRYAWHVSRRSLANYLAADGFDVWNLDFRGAGRSRALGTPAPEGFADLVEGDLPRIVDAVREAAGEERLFLVGHSLGGAVACAFAGRSPGLVRGVVTIAGLYGFGRSGRFVRALGAAGVALARTGLAPLVFPGAVRTDLVGELLRLTAPAWSWRAAARLAPLHAWAPGSFEPEVLAEALRRSFEPASFGVTLGLAAMALGAPFGDGRGSTYFDAFERRSDIPVLVVAGSHDTLVSSEDSICGFDRFGARDKTRRIFGPADGGHGWGHMDLLLGRDAPGHVWPLVRTWLRER